MLIEVGSITDQTVKMPELTEVLSNKPAEDAADGFSSDWANESRQRSAERQQRVARELGNHAQPQELAGRPMHREQVVVEVHLEQIHSSDTTVRCAR